MEQLVFRGRGNTKYWAQTSSKERVCLINRVNVEKNILLHVIHDGIRLTLLTVLKMLPTAMELISDLVDPIQQSIKSGAGPDN